jgi:hypothetical protein
MMSASLSDVVSLARGWQEKKTPIRWSMSLTSSVLFVNCFVISVTEEAIGLGILGQTRTGGSIHLVGCEFWFGEGDLPSSEYGESQIKFNVGISMITVGGESVWLYEIEESLAAN